MLKPSRHQQRLVGVALDFHDNEHAAVWHDVTGIVGNDVVSITSKSVTGKYEEKAAVPTIIKLIRAAEALGVDVRMIALADPLPYAVLDDLPKIWLHVDAIPVHIPTHTRTLAPTPCSRASYAIEHALAALHPASSSATVATVQENDRLVLVDSAGKDGKVCIAGRREYEQSTSPELYGRFRALTYHLRHAQRTRIVFFSATPQGGGVALMRHALVRLWRLHGLDVKWYVPEAHSTIFDITKRKLHNVLQGVAPEGVELDDQNKKDFELWGEQNYYAYWRNVNADIFVIDDPQLTPIIPLLKKYTRSKIIFRSHIQIRADLVDTPGTPQQRTWDYLFNFIKETHLFLSHPVEAFVPKNVKKEMNLLYSPPSTDPIDGLNKPYGGESVSFFREDFERLSLSQCGVKPDWSRGYIVQVARFDPSKAIDVLLAAYLRFRKQVNSDRAPQLIIVGHGSVDDPDGRPIFRKVQDILNSDEYKDVREDVAVVRAPPSDSLLGVLVQGAWVVTQLSTREGFEVKVTEAVDKGVPVIASDAGGIPLQVPKGRGWIVPAGEPEPVADLLCEIYAGKVFIKDTPHVPGESPVDQAANKWVQDIDAEMPRRTTSEDFWTVGNAAKWMLLAARLLELPIEEGKYAQVLKNLDVETPLPNDKHVWDLLMGKDVKEGEARIIRTT